MPQQNGPYKGQLIRVHQGLPEGSCRVPECWQPANLLALHYQKAHLHVDA